MDRFTTFSAKSTLGFAIIALLSFGSSTVFSADEDEESDSIEEVVVTGSRISRSSTFDSTGPVEVFTVEQILESGKNNVGDYLIELPSANLSSNQRSINNGNSGTTEFNLRGAGSERLLTLINGRRVAPAGTGTGSAVDFQIFPLALIDSVEVLKDGASAVYGSDAVSGVVNIKLRDFEGFEVYGQEGASDQGDANATLLSLAFGTKGENSSIKAAISFNKNDSLDMWDRDFSYCPRVEPEHMVWMQSYGIPGYGSNGDMMGDTAMCGASTFTPAGRFYTSTGSKTMLNGTGPGGTTSGFTWYDYTGYSPQTATGLGMYNYSQWMQLLGGRENFQAWSTGDYETESGIVLDFELGASKRKSDLMMAPVPMGNGAQKTYGMTIGADNPFNPFGEDIKYRKRMLDVGTRNFSQEADTLRLVLGASGSLDILGGADWELYTVHQEFDSTQRTDNYINMLRVTEALDTEKGAGIDVGGTQYRCKDAIARQLGCVPLNMFGFNSISTAAADYIRFNQLNKTSTLAKEYAGNLTNIEIAELPAGMVLAAVGFDIFDLEGSEKVDALTEAGASSGNPRLSTSGSYKNTDWYVEASIPLLADMTLAQELTLDVAYRETDYDAFASSSVDRYALKYKPINDVTIRATSSSSYKAPTISNLYFGGGGGFPTYTDPCAAKNYIANPSATTLAQCAAVGIDSTTYQTANNQILAISAGNPSLTPEEGTNQTYGIVWQPTSISFLEDIGFKIAVDSFELEIGNAVVSSGAQNAIDGCYITGTSSLCNDIDRNFGGDINSVTYRLINSDSVDVYKGTDYAINFSFDELPRIGGSLQVDIIGTHLKENVTVDSSGKGDDFVGKCYDFGESCFNRDKTTLALRWQKDEWRVGLTTRRLSGIDVDPDAVAFYTNDLGVPVNPYDDTPFTTAQYEQILDIHSIDDYYVHNLNVGYSITDSITASLAISNLLDEEPPYYKDFYGFVDPQINTPQNTYDIVGRYYTFGIKIAL